MAILKTEEKIQGDKKSFIRRKKTLVTKAE